MEQELFISRILSVMLNMDDYMGSQYGVSSTSISSTPPSGPLVFPSGSRGTLHSPVNSIRIDANPRPISFKMGEPFHTVTTGFQCSVVHVASGPKRCSSEAIPASTARQEAHVCRVCADIVWRLLGRTATIVALLDGTAHAGGRETGRPCLLRRWLSWLS